MNILELTEQRLGQDRRIRRTSFNAFGQAPPRSLETMKLDEWLTRLVAVPPGRNPLANGIAIGMRIALFILVPLGIIAAIAILFLHR